jgi:hypothetical protein
MTTNQQWHPIYMPMDHNYLITTHTRHSESLYGQSRYIGSLPGHDRYISVHGKRISVHDKRLSGHDYTW